MPNPIELFEKLCKAWDIELVPNERGSSFRRSLVYEGETLDVVWSPAVVEDLMVFHGPDAGQELLRSLVDQVIVALLQVKEEKALAS